MVTKRMEEPMEPWEQTALNMLRKSRWEEEDSHIRGRLALAAMLIKNVGGKLKSRQVISAIIVSAGR